MAVLRDMKKVIYKEAMLQLQNFSHRRLLIVCGQFNIFKRLNLPSPVGLSHDLNLRFCPYHGTILYLGIKPESSLYKS